MIGGDPQAEERVGSVLHEKWTLERLLGVGGMGAVYAARHRNGARAAVKVLSSSMGRVPHIRKRFLHEGYAANRVEHGGAVKVLDDDVIPDGTEEGTAYLVMELLEGESLGERAKREPPLTERDLLAIADGVLAVLDAAHANGVVHRDLKPDNLFLARDPERDGTQIKVLDFGLARLLEAHETTIAGMALGTPTYMSPEQAAGKVDQIDGRTDIYALGSILFQLASNRRIHEAAHTLGLVVRMATTPAPKLQSVAPEVSDAFARVVDRALAFDRGDRYPTAAAMRADVQAALAALPAEGSTVNVVPVAPVSIEALRSQRDRDDDRRIRERADTVRAEAVTVAAAPVPRREREAREEASAELPPRRDRGRAETGSPLRTAFLIAILGGGGFFLWTNRATIAQRLAPIESASASASALASSLPPVAAEIEAGPHETPADVEVPAPIDASALVIGPMDAMAFDEPADASVDGGDDEEEDEEEDIDAGPDASAAGPSPSAAPGPRRGSASSHPTAKPPPKKRPPRRPGQPRKRKRRHW